MIIKTKTIIKLIKNIAIPITRIKMIINQPIRVKINIIEIIMKMIIIIITKIIKNQVIKIVKTIKTIVIIITMIIILEVV